MAILARLRHDSRGAAVIELGLIGMFLSIMLVGLVDLSRGYSARLRLEQVAQRTIEKVMNGRASTNAAAIGDTAAALKTEAATEAGVAESAVTVTYWLECNGAKQASFNTACASGTPYARYMNVSIAKVYTPMFARTWGGADSGNTFNLTGSAGVRFQ